MPNQEENDIEDGCQVSADWRPAPRQNLGGNCSKHQFAQLFITWLYLKELQVDT